MVALSGTLVFSAMLLLSNEHSYVARSILRANYVELCCAENHRTADSCLAPSETKALLSVAISSRAGSTCPPRNLTNVDIESNRIHFSETRFTGCPKCSKSRRLATFLPATILLWNSLPSLILSSSSPACFSHLLDSHFEFESFSFGLLQLSSVVISRNVFKLVFDCLTILVKNILNTIQSGPATRQQQELSSVNWTASTAEWMLTPRHSIGQTSSSMQLWKRRGGRLEKKLWPTKRVRSTLAGRSRRTPSSALVNAGGSQWNNVIIKVRDLQAEKCKARLGLKLKK